MKKLLLMAALALNALAQAQTALMPGDLIFISLRCYICPVIENETGTPFSHVGVVISTNPQIEILEARGTVHLTPLVEYLNSARAQSYIAVVRPDLERVPDFLSLAQEFQGRTYDVEFNWEEDDALYCTELVAKMLRPYLRYPLTTLPMDFSKNWPIWEQYFGGQVPQGRPGLTPKNLLHAPGMQLISVGALP